MHEVIAADSIAKTFGRPTSDSRCVGTRGEGGGRSSRSRRTAQRAISVSDECSLQPLACPSFCATQRFSWSCSAPRRSRPRRHVSHECNDLGRAAHGAVGTEVAAGALYHRRGDRARAGPGRARPRGEARLLAAEIGGASRAELPAGRQGEARRSDLVPDRQNASTAVASRGVPGFDGSCRKVSRQSCLAEQNTSSKPTAMSKKPWRAARMIVRSNWSRAADTRRR